MGSVTVGLSGAQWFKSSYSSGSQECVEVAHLERHLVGVRDSKDPAGAMLAFSLDEWDAFTRAVHGGAF
ncbi:DUF397 domain-containing protein [Nocardia sp. NPDC024068]|uniref:DUF397 domain-containing protein n=1 Tax=Nocardia sp. NPDC024068 TaxID=3157197 RepID=UPI0033F3EC57